MKKSLRIILSVALVLALSISLYFIIKGRDRGDGQPSYSFINDVNLEEFSIVYSASDLDYSKRAAEYIHTEILSRTGLDLPLVLDSKAKGEHEIVVGNTMRDISHTLDAPTTGLEFAILAEGGSVALEGDYFVIAAAAYFFIDTYVPNDDFRATIPQEVKIHEPIIKEAKNFILLIGDGMGVNQTRLFEYLANTCDYSDGEELFYGYMLPYMGFSRTDSLSGTTDSAAGGTALSSGTKTINGYVGIDKNSQNLLLLPELFGSLGKASAVMSTETQTGATPSSFSAHANDRDSSADIILSQQNTTKQYGTIIDCGYNYYTKHQLAQIETHITNTLEKVAADEDGFFLMYEEAHIDKHCHSNDMDKTFLALMRFNQAIARFMEFAFYHPDTFVLITADHETGKLLEGDDGELHYNSEDHSSANVPVFAYGDGAELFDGKTIENIQIAHTIASFVGVTDFGDQSEFQYLK